MKATQCQGSHALHTSAHGIATQQQACRNKLCREAHLVCNVADLLLQGVASAADGLAHVFDNAKGVCPAKGMALEAYLTGIINRWTGCISAIASHPDSLKDCRSNQRFCSQSFERGTSSTLIDAELHPAEANICTEKLQLCEP